MSSTSGRRLRGAELRARCVDLRKSGLSYAEIASVVGCSRTMAHKHVTTALRDLAQNTNESADELRTLELARLDGLLSAMWPAATSGDFRAVDRVLRITERRAKLLGLDVQERPEPPFKLGVEDVFKSDTIEAARKRQAERMLRPDLQPRGLPAPAQTNGATDTLT